MSSDYYAGRPTTYKPEYDEMLINHMSEGFTYESFAGVVRCARSTIYEWEKHNPTFSDAKKIGFSLMQLHDEKLYLDGMKGKNQKINATLMLFKMKNCHGWRDTIQTESTQAIKIFEVVEFDENTSV